MASVSNHIANINRALKNIKLNVLADYVWQKSTGIIIVTNKVALPSDLQIIENLKIIGISYFIENTNIPISSNFVESVIKSNHIFNNLLLASNPQVIKVSSKSDIAIVWVDLWNAQSGFKAKNLINRSFNIGNYIATIHSTNMNPDVLQYKNCWK